MRLLEHGWLLGLMPEFQLPRPSEGPSQMPKKVKEGDDEESEVKIYFSEKQGSDFLSAESMV